VWIEQTMRRRTPHSHSRARSPSSHEMYTVLSLGPCVLISVMSIAWETPSHSSSQRELRSTLERG
jgi:hypothetical protein